MADVEIARLVTRFEADISDVRREMRSLDRVTDKTAGDMGRRFAVVGRRIGTAFAAIGGAIGVGATFRGLLDVNIEFERLEARLRTFTRGDAKEAARLFEVLADTASDLPFSIDQTVDAFARLGLLGLKPSTDAIKSFANIASAVGTQGAQSLKQVVEAVADATTMEFERLKELGIVARKEGNQVNITFRGTTKSVEATAASIAAFFEQLGMTEFSGAATEQMKGLEGAISNLGDAFKRAAKDIGESGFNKALTTVINAITPAVQPATNYLIAAVDSIVNAFRDIVTSTSLVRGLKDIAELRGPFDIRGGLPSAAGPTAPMTGIIGGIPGRDYRGIGGSLGRASGGAIGGQKIEEKNSMKTLRTLQSIDGKLTFTNIGAVMQ